MAYKLGFLLSLFFVIQVIAYSGDVAAISMIHTSLDAVAVTASYEISLHSKITPEIVAYVKEEADASIEQTGSGTVAFGQPLTFRVFRTYDPLIISSSIMTISVTRSAVIGYFN